MRFIASWIAVSTLALGLATPTLAKEKSCEEECREDTATCVEMCKQVAGAAVGICSDACRKEEPPCLENCRGTTAD